ncbi:restriction endonuclease PLD domain-containing protein [Candidatus Latescibacterota bacterium]
MNIQVLTNELSEEILIGPLQKIEADSINILSGYASASAASRHLQELSKISSEFNVRLTIGMTRDGAVTQSSHLAFKRLAGEFYIDNFFCHYMPLSMPIHSKIYVWTKRNNPVHAWCCSANYTQAALYNMRQQEVVSVCDPSQALNIFLNAFSQSMSCGSPSASEVVESKRYENASVGNKELHEETTAEWSLLSGRTEDGLRYGINWGHRGERNRNEAYIPIPSTVYNTNFFPNRPNYFTVRTDDEYIFTCVREQDSGKAMTTPLNNSDIGLWLRKRIGLQSGDRITAENLIKANATVVAFTKTDEDEYYLTLRGE